jgi:hypothetical protein
MGCDRCASRFNPVAIKKHIPEVDPSDALQIKKGSLKAAFFYLWLSYSKDFQR